MALKWRAGRWIVAGTVVALAAAGCGSSGSKTATTKTAGGPPVGQRGDAILTGAYTKAIAAKSAKLDLTGSFTTPAKTIAIDGSGAFDWGRGLGQFTAQVPTGTQTLTVTEIIDDGDLYIQLPAAAAQQLGGKPWIKINLSGLEGSGQSNPAQTLAILEGSSDQITNLGSQTIDGVATTHYQAQVDPTKAAPTAPPVAQKLLQQLPALTGSTTFPVDVWIDRQGLPRQIAYTITLQHAPAGASATAAQAFPETTKLTMGLSDYGTAVSVTIPPPDQVSTQSIPGLTGGSASS